MAHPLTALPALMTDGGPSDALHLLGYDGGDGRSSTGSGALDQQRTLERFLAGVERRAYRMARIATRNSDDALDIVQDAMLKLVEKYADRSEAELGPLFHCILQSRIRDWYRRSTVRNRLRSWLGSDDDSEEDALQLIADPAGRTPEDILAARGGIEALEEALQSLPLRQQQAFLLRAWEGLDVKDTARAMKCAEGSVKTHYSRALAALRVKLGEHWS
ncbi:MAG: RNA polymerase sigma factor [Pseudomonadota bacterium]|nr:RNA polymerase sigma factor [Pseudomonadota bacterium]